jgi:signal recognition particle receptor subunit beta
MVFFNYATMQMAAKIVYYGPGLCGKTTNLHWIYAKTAPQSRGEMVSLETETDRTLFFDLLPLDVGVIGGFKTRLQLYTVPGQVFYNTTRKLVLKGVDGIVFVADLQRAMIDANIESFKNLRENLSEIGVNLDEIPLVVQLNKKDLPNVIEHDTLLDALDPERRYPAIESSAVNGEGVFETLKEISKLTLRTLRRRMMGEESARTPIRPAVLQPPRTREAPVGFNPPPALPKTTPPPAAAMGTSTLSAGSGTIAAPQAFHSIDPIGDLPTASPRIDENPFPDSGLEGEALDLPQEPESEELSRDTAGPELAESFPEPEAQAEPEPIIDDAPEPEPIAEAAPEPEPPSPAPPPPDPEVTFTRAPAGEPVAPPVVKRVKVRSTADIFAELDALKKMATQGSARPKPAPPAQNISVNVPLETLAATRMLRMSFLFEDGKGDVVQRIEESVELETDRDVQSVLVRLKTDKSS